jgi:hypothetical protein
MLLVPKPKHSKRNPSMSLTELFCDVDDFCKVFAGLAERGRTSIFLPVHPYLSITDVSLSIIIPTKPGSSMLISESKKGCVLGADLKHILFS